jgi:serine/threonine-protein kinase
MVMEYLEGDDLATLLAGRPQLEVERAVGLVVQACFGIGEAHARGMVHRDLKPENLISCQGPDGEPLLKLLDFGLSKERERPHQRKRALTHEAQAMGTPHYMAPEQWLSAKDVGATADQWALGVILFEMLGGRRPFDGDQLALICSQTLNAPTPSLRQLRPDLPAGLEAVLFRCLEKDPRRRYENVGALALALSPFAPPGTAAKAEALLQMLRQAVDVIEDKTALAQWPARLAPSDMLVTEKRPAHDDLALRGRSVTAQSWNSALGRAATRSRIAVGLAVLAVAAMVVVSVAILGRGSEGAPSSDRPAQAVPPIVAADDDERTGLAAADGAAPVASSAQPAATALASASSTVAAPKRPAAPPATAPRPRAQPAEKHGDLFEERY